MDRDQPRLYAPSLREAVAGEQDVLALEAAVERLDLSALEACYQRVGHPAYPPKVMLKVLLYGYALGLRASRQMERACRFDVAFQFLAGGLTPDFRTLCRFRRKHAQELAELFVQTVRLCQEGGLVSLGEVAIDGTKLRADRSRKAIAAAKEVLVEALAEAEAADSDIAPEQEGDGRGADGECQLMKTSEGIRPAYNAQLAVDADQGVIVAQAVLTAPVDQGQLPQILAQVKRNCNFLPQRTLADGGYYSGQSVAALAQETDLYLPLPATGAQRFVWVAEAGAYRCPAGQFLRPYRIRKGLQVYRTHSCGACSRRRECGITGRYKELHLPAGAEEAIAQLRERMGSAAGQEIYAARKKIVEPLFGWIKHNWGLRRLLLRGRVGAGIEWALVCIGHNLKRWANSALALRATELSFALFSLLWGLLGSISTTRARNRTRLADFPL